MHFFFCAGGSTDRPIFTNAPVCTTILPTSIVEARNRGYLSHVLADFGDGRLFPLFFYDLVRLRQDLEERVKHNIDFIADPGIVVVQEISLKAMQHVIEQLYEEGFFDHIVPITEVELASSNPYQWPPNPPRKFISPASKPPHAGLASWGSWGMAGMADIQRSHEHRG